MAHKKAEKKRRENVLNSFIHFHYHYFGKHLSRIDCIVYSVYLFTAVARTKFYKYLLFVMLNDVLLFMHFISEVKAWVYNYCVLSLW